MKELNQNEYQSVILAGLLHDIDKFLLKPNGKSPGHDKRSGCFIDDCLKGKSGLRFDAELIKNIIHRHHNLKRNSQANEVIVDKIVFDDDALVHHPFYFDG